MVEQRSFSVRRCGHFGDKLREFLHVPRLDLDELVDSFQIVGMVRDRMEGIRNADMVVGPVRPFRNHDVGNHASEVGLEGERNQIEHQLHLLGEILQLANGSIGNLQTGKIHCSGLLRPALDLADGFQVAVENGAVVISNFTLELFGAVPDEIQDAVGLIPDECALLRVVPFTEQLQENFPRIVFHRQR